MDLLHAASERKIFVVFFEEKREKSAKKHLQLTFFLRKQTFFCFADNGFNAAFLGVVVVRQKGLLNICASLRQLQKLSLIWEIKKGGICTV